MKTRFHYLSLFLAMVIAATFSPRGMTADIEDGLVFYLSFDGGEVVDKSPNPAKVAVDAGLKIVDGKIGKALEVDATNVVEIDDADKLDGMENLTIALWINPEKNTEAGIVSKRVAYQVNDSYSVYLDETAFLVGRVKGINQLTSTVALQAGTWYHIVYVFEGFEGGLSTQKLYIDGVLDSQANHPDQEIPTNESQLWIGELHRGRGWNYGGLVDELGIWSRVLSEEEIKQTMAGLSFAVDPQEKLTTTWGDIKRQ